MRRRQHSSPISAPFRCEWRPSRWLTGALLGLAALAAVAILNCELDGHYAWPLALCACMAGVARAHMEARRPRRCLLLPAPPGVPRIDDIVVEQVELLERGPLRILRWRQGRRRRQLLFWPDTLPPAERRELRLAVRALGVSRRPGRMAP